MPATTRCPHPGPPPQAGEGEEICCTTRATREQQHRVRHHRAASTACSLSRLRGGVRVGALILSIASPVREPELVRVFRLDPITCARCWNCGTPGQSMIELRQFRQFIAVAEELSFRRAADRLHMAQPPLTVTIKQIEEELGTLLIERTNRIA